jgi:hypothetical protein
MGDKVRVVVQEMTKNPVTLVTCHSHSAADPAIEKGHRKAITGITSMQLDATSWVANSPQCRTIAGVIYTSTTRLRSDVGAKR